MRSTEAWVPSGKTMAGMRATGRSPRRLRSRSPLPMSRRTTSAPVVEVAPAESTSA